MKYLIVGNNLKGVYAAHKIREFDSEAKISIALPRSGSPIDESRIFDYLKNSVKENTLNIKKDSFYGKNKINVLNNMKFKYFDKYSKEVYFEGDKKIKYDVLIFAIHSLADVEYFKKGEMEKEFPFVSVESIKKLKNELVPLDRVGVFGSDMFSIALSVNLSMLGLKPVLFANSNSIMGGIFTKDQIKALVDVLENKDVEIVFAEKIEKIDGHTVYIKGEEKKEFEKIFNCDKENLIEKAILNNFENIGKIENKKISDSVYVINNFNSTQIDEIKNEVDVLVKSMFSENKEINFNNKSTVIKEVNLALVGEYYITDNDKYDIIIMSPTREYKKVVLKDNVLKGFAFIGDCKRVNVFKDYIDKKTKLSNSEIRELFV